MTVRILLIIVFYSVTTLFSRDFIDYDSIRTKDRFKVPPTKVEKRRLESLRAFLPQIAIALGSGLLAVHFKEKANYYYRKYERNYLFQEKARKYKKQVKKYDNISAGFSVILEFDILWLYYELIKTNREEYEGRKP